MRASTGACLVALVGVVGPARAADLEAARAALATGHYEDVGKLVGGGARDDADVLLARAELLTGKYAAAEQRLAALGQRSPMQLEGRVLLGRLYLATGRPVLAKMLWNKTFDDY